MILIGLILNSLSIPLLDTPIINNALTTTDRDGYANILYWDEGVMIWAHNGLTGAEFYNVQSLTGLYADGSTAQFEVIEIGTWDAGEDWMQALNRYSDQTTITLVTCYPMNASDGRLLVELKRINNDDCIRHLSQSC